MSALKNLNIGVRLGLAFVTVIALTVVIGAMSVSRLSGLRKDLRITADDCVPKLQQVIQVIDDMNLITIEMRAAIFHRDDQKVNAAQQTVLAPRARTGKTFEAMTPTLTSDEGKKHLAASRRPALLSLPCRRISSTWCDQARRTLPLSCWKRSNYLRSLSMPLHSMA